MENHHHRHHSPPSCHYSGKDSFRDDRRPNKRRTTSFSSMKRERERETFLVCTSFVVSDCQTLIVFFSRRYRDDSIKAIADYGVKKKTVEEAEFAYWLLLALLSLAGSLLTKESASF